MLVDRIFPSDEASVQEDIPQVAGHRVRGNVVIILSKPEDRT